MARISHTRTSRTVVTIVVLAITIAAAIEFHRSRSNARGSDTAKTAAPLAIVVRPTTAPVAVAVTAQPKPALPKPLITETPYPGNPNSAPPPAMWATNASSTPAPGSPPTSPQAGKPQPPQAPIVKPVADIQLPATSDLLAKAKSMIDSGDLLAARKLLNESLLSGQLSTTDTEAVKKQMSDINQTVVFSPRPFPNDPLGGVYTVKPGERLASIGNAHGVPFEFLLMLNRMTDARRLRFGQTLKVINGPFYVVVTKSKFTLDVYLGSPGGADSTYITTFPVGLGTDNSTPTGTWIIKNKVTHPAYFPPEGRSGDVLEPNDPKNPLGPCWMGLEGTDGKAVGAQSYGIHGTIDPNSIGKQSSMGCIRMHNEDVQVLYKMLVPGKTVVVVKD